MNFSDLENFNVEIIEHENSFKKIRVEKTNLKILLSHLKNNSEFAFERLNTIIAVDLADKFELIYDLNSIAMCENLRVSVLFDRNTPSVASVVDIFKGAYFDECEIFDLFGIKFENNPNLKRLLMPVGWKGHPLRKDYVQDDERLAWNG